MEQPKVSVITICRNAASELERTVRQTEDTYRKALNSEDETLRYENEKEYGYASIEK